MPENSRIQIHARVMPNRAAAAPIQPESDDSRCKEQPYTNSPGRRRVRKLTRGDRLLRNSTIACALLLGILALGNLDAPWARKASDGIERALSMHIDLDENIGALQFVKDLMPESTLVFMNLGGSETLRPVDGAISHRWTNLQPWMMFKCAEGAEVRAIHSGTVTAVSQLSSGSYGVLLDQGDGIETLYAGLSGAEVSQGDVVEQGQPLGTGTESVYFEYRSSGESIDPAALLGL